jgi:hypothetical protein
MAPTPPAQAHTPAPSPGPQTIIGTCRLLIINFSWELFVRKTVGDFKPMVNVERKMTKYYFLKS